MKLRRALPAAIVMAMTPSVAVYAHDVGVTRVELREKPGGRYVLTAGVPSALAPYCKPLILPERFAMQNDPTSTGQSLSGMLRYEFSSPDSPLTASDTLLLDWPRDGALVKVRWLDGTEVSQFFPRITGGIEIEMSMLLAGSGSVIDTASRYTGLGIKHILLGIDHLLFVLGLLLIVRDGWTLVKTITAFTVAHSISLALATLGVVQVPARSVDAAIALSIVFLAIEILNAQRGRGSLATRAPWVVAFAFGLLHGLGFAGALNALGLPQSEIIQALLFFNVGVEIGQLIFVFTFLALLWSFRRLEVVWPAWTRPIPAYLIGTFAMYWFLGRVAQIIPGPWSA